MSKSSERGRKEPGPENGVEVIPFWLDELPPASEYAVWRLESRYNHGMEKYGVALKAGPGAEDEREWSEEALEEVDDAIVYAMAAALEGENLDDLAEYLELASDYVKHLRRNYL